jgi:hypothetical protein
MQNKYLLLIIMNVILIGIFCLLYRTPIVETYTNIGDDEHMREQKSTVEYLESKESPTLIDEIKIKAYDPSVFFGDKTIYNDQKNTFDPVEGDYELNEIATDIMNENNNKIDWRHVYVNDSSKVFAVIPNPSTSIDDLYGHKGLLNSDFKEDICTKYIGDLKTINKKCKQLSATNCKIPDCCVLLNGTKCVSGNINGPTFLTENGKSVDQLYFYHKDKCYGNCETSDTYADACGNYSKDSTGISKECMIQMFNNYGCPNPKPDSLINDQMVKDYKNTTMEYVGKYIKTAMDIMTKNYNNESDALCTGNK